MNKSKFGDSLIWARILLSMILAVLVGIVATREANPDLFNRLTWVFIALSAALTGIMVRVVYRMLRHPEDVDDEEA